MAQLFNTTDAVRLQTTSQHLAIVSGGTAGHVFPALAIAQAWSEAGGNVTFIGARGGLEQDLVKSAGWDFKGLSSRPFFGVSALGRLAATGPLAVAVRQCRNSLSHHAPQLVLGTGGHVSAAATGVPWVAEENWETDALAFLLQGIFDNSERWRSILHGLRAYARPDAAQGLVQDLVTPAAPEPDKVVATEGPVTPNA